ncbi:MAG TPA: endonuclease/exonuclease/phosphatase family protein [Tepidisphaeraceae bacterium]|nr:endonuclease/exonuclease/phosphatase family protein [Tepidisphaeraceae bacterium]
MDSGHTPDATTTASRTSPARRRRWLFWLCATYAIGAIAYWLCIRYLGDRWWPATILLFAPRWPWLLPATILIPLAIRKKKLAWIPLLTVCFVVGPLMGFSVPWRRWFSSADSKGELRLLVCNVHHNELDLPAMDRYIAGSAPGIVLLQDYSGHDASPLLMKPDWHRYRLGEIFIASRYPILHTYDLHLERVAGVDDSDLPVRTGSAVCFDVQTPTETVHVLNLHLASPHGGIRAFRRDMNKGIRRLEMNTARRRKESQVISDWLRAQTGPVIIAGDFNTPAESPIYREFWSGYPDAFASAGFGFGYTHISPFSELRIDHLLTTPGITCTSCETGPPCGTPHRPMLVDLRM